MADGRRRLPAIDAPGFLLVGLCVLFSLCVAYGIAAYPWTDEIQTRAYAEQTFGELWSSYYAHRTYAMVAKGSCWVFGENRVALRMPAAIGGIASLIALYLLGCRLFDRATGWIAASYLSVHAIFLQYCKEARGFTLGILFLTLGCIALWRTMEKPRLGWGIGFIVSFYFAYLFHPTMALVFPGILAASTVAAGRRLYSGGWEWRRFLRNPMSIGAIGVAALVGGVLAFPYLRSYMDWGTLLIPEHTQSREAGSLPPPFRTWGSFFYYSAPLFISPRHWGLSLYFALALAVCGLAGLRGRFSETLFVALPAAAPIPFFWVVPFERIPERYLLGCLPFVCLLVAVGIRNLSGLLGERLRQTAALVLTLSLLALCIRPFLAETLYGRKPGQDFYRPFLELVTSEPFAEWKVAFDSPNSFYQNHLHTLGLPEEKVLEDEWTVSESIPSEGIWVCPTDPKRYVEVDERLQGRGLIPVDLHGMRVYFYSPDFENEDRKRETIAALLDIANENLRLDYRTELSLSGLAAQHLLNKRENRFLESGEAKIGGVLFLDPERRAHAAVNARVKRLLARGQTIEAAKAYLAAIEEDPDAVPAFYIELFENLPKPRWPFIANLRGFDSLAFAKGFLSSLDGSVNLTPERRAELAYRLGNILLHTGQFDAVRLLLEYSIENGEPGGEAEKLLGLLEDIETNWSEETMREMCR